MGIATKLEQSIDLLLANYVTSKSAAVCGALVPLALTGVTIYIITIGWAIMRGDAQDSFHTALWKMFKIAMIVSIALTAGNYQAYAVNFIEGIQGAFITAFGNAGTIGGLIDNMAQPYNDLGQKLWSEATTGFWPHFSLLAAAGIVAIAQAFLFVVGLGMYLLAKVSLALVLAVGPAFIFCALFGPTQKYTESWIGQAMQFVLLNVLVGASISMLTDFASQFAANINNNFGAASIIKDTLALLLVSGALAIVMLNLSTIASALSGGASISGIGRDIARAMMAGKAPKPPKTDGGKGGGGEIKGQGNNPADRAKKQQQSSNSGRQASQPAALYQRYVQDNIRKSN